MNLASKLVSLRTARSISQEELAAELGVSRQTIGKWEAGTALPELPGLIALSRFYSVAIDALVHEHPCDLQAVTSVEPDELCSFLLRAKRSTYAGYAPESLAQRPHAHEFYYAEKPFTYRDSYFGGRIFHGEEIVCRDGQPLWCMNYSGRVLSDTFSGDFLKLALQHGTPDMPWRGPKLFHSSEYTYVCTCPDDLYWFSGTETIYYGEALIYECRFHGGIIR